MSTCRVHAVLSGTCNIFADTLELELESELESLSILCQFK